MLTSTQMVDCHRFAELVLAPAPVVPPSVTLVTMENPDALVSGRGGKTTAGLLNFIESPLKQPRAVALPFFPGSVPSPTPR